MNEMETGRRFLVIILILVAMGAIYFVFVKEPESVSVNSTGEVPNPASLYLSNLKDLEGNPIAMDENKLVFLNIWATWCGPCNMEMPGIQKLYDKYKNHKSVAFYIISDEDAETVNPFIARKGYQLPFYQYAGTYPEALDGNAIPRTYIIHKGKILAEQTGASQWDTPEVVSLIEKNISEI
ncbi:Thiol-disulfide oxidoreductase ResA [Dyadobacter sp. CECT 9275]|uniref:Thiol-disulfide oxidoreductase ResA n=1 Tax=Dyadobacter helix TaxID=2822344 RepID=A0A916NJV4_9BACT|nr:TlpA disulfide reductase family protein [Dyadobacter sp. CECT 9275]CAG4991326.1 Thiol-disulfide oxidoreductase ResA [Dyadobacter sp. CECT 9275]